MKLDIDICVTQRGLVLAAWQVPGIGRYSGNGETWHEALHHLIDLLKKDGVIVVSKDQTAQVNQGKRS